MEFFNLPISTLHAIEYISSEPRERATWLNVAMWSVQQENGGRIVGAAKWKDRQWQQTCGVMQREVRAAGRLLVLDGDDVRVWNYPVESEQRMKTKREIAKANGQNGGRPPSPPKQPMLKPTSVSHAVTDRRTEDKPRLPTEHEPTSESVREGKGKEGKESPPTPQPRGGAAEREARRTLPTAIDTPIVRAAWSRWIDHLIDRKRGNMPSLQTLDAHVFILGAMSPENAVLAIETAIKRDWAEPALPHDTATGGRAGQPSRYAAAPMR